MVLFSFLAVSLWRSYGVFIVVVSCLVCALLRLISLWVCFFPVVAHSVLLGSYGVIYVFMVCASGIHRVFWWCLYGILLVFLFGDVLVLSSCSYGMIRLL